MEKQELSEREEKTGNNADRVEIVFYTDPLCCWSWAFEPQWRRLQFEYGDKIVFRNVMTGLLPSWKNYHDEIYSVSKPLQMGPVWLEASETSGMPIYDKIWVEDAPASSYPACIAVKSAELQSKIAGIKYLRRLREAVMLQGKNIAKQEMLLQVAVEVAGVFPGLLSVEKFEQDLLNDNGLEAFRKDWQDAQNRHIARTPTLIMRASKRPAIMLTGYRPYAVLVEALKQMLPALKPFTGKISNDDYRKFWGNITAREVSEMETNC